MLLSFMQRRSLTLVELTVIICVILVLAGLKAFYLQPVLKTARETALMNELSNLRMSIELYRVINGKFPEDISFLTKKGFTEEKFRSIMFSRNYLQLCRFDKKGNLLDPFGQRYAYNPKEGRVSSLTEGYEGW